MAAVSDTDSPSQLQTARQPQHVDDQAFGLGRGRRSQPSASRADRCIRATVPPRAAPGRSASAARCSAAVPCRCQARRGSMTSPACDEPCERVRDGRPLGADQPPEQPVGERQRDSGAAVLHPAPAAGECQSSRVSRSSRRGCEVIARWTSRSAARMHGAEQLAGDLRPGLDPLGERVVEECEARGHERMPGRVALEQIVGAGRETAAGRRRRRRSRWPCGRRRATSTLSDAVDHEQAGSVTDLGEAALEVAVPRPASRRRRPSRPAARPGACAGRVRRRGRRRDRGGSGTTRSESAAMAREVAKSQATSARSRSLRGLCLGMAVLLASREQAALIADCPARNAVIAK